MKIELKKEYKNGDYWYNIYKNDILEKCLFIVNIYEKNSYSKIKKNINIARESYLTFINKNKSTKNINREIILESIEV